MKHKHTPGPWVRNQYGTIKANGETLRVNGVSLPCGGRPRDFDEIEANSNLIAAAPDLLDALQALLDADLYADGEGVVFFKNTDTESGERAVKMACAAIAKAKGQQEGT
jgi:hypothetical protein